ncbi:hypothetical protein AB833_16145 [Chromatiales bacterium (ex Bugula neritina AB1)]|nr:hypothetical protein AB833_16145 [Chromatiales bacterium (ex Bugula neritina AB1)]
MNNEQNSGVQSNEINGRSAAGEDAGLFEEFSVTNDAACTLLSKLVDNSSTILDFGCGSGGTGAVLQSLGMQHLIGLDSSSEKLHAAEKCQYYKQTIQCDLTKECSAAITQGDAGICVNVIGFCEVGLEHFGVLLSMLKKDAPLLVSISAEEWDTRQWPEALDAAQTERSFIVEYINSLPACASNQPVRLLLIRNSALESVSDESSG